MDNTLGFAHFLSNADGVARFVIGLILLGSVGTWYLILTKGLQVIRMRQRSEAFLAVFWDVPDPEAVATRLRERAIAGLF